MSYSTNDGVQAEPPHEPEVSCTSTDTSSSDTCAFPGDLGRIPHETRRVLVQLLLGPAVDGRRQGNLWAVLLRDEAVVRERLHELFLELVIDYEQKVAFTRQVAADDIEIPVLLRRAHLTFLESVLLLFLRQRLTQAQTQLERAVVSWQDMVEHLSVYERSGNVDHARFDKQRHGAIEKVKKLNLIQRIRGAEDRFEVSPTLKLLFPAEEIQALTRTYQELTHPPSPTHSGKTDDMADEADAPGDDDE
ncbi:MAG TPA: DUF4194 domain-containing protein [Azonexus sp.]|nr:DUF4194 domain-containing protein [Azonexus sp.]